MPGGLTQHDLIKLKDKAPRYISTFYSFYFKGISREY